MRKSKNENIKVKMFIPKGTKKKMMFSQTINNFGTLGREIKVSPKANITVNAPGFKAEYFCPTVSVVIGIGKDNTAELIMTDEAFEALRKGEKLTITTTKEFKKNFL
jgi:hypothetical protein